MKVLFLDIDGVICTDRSNIFVPPHEDQMEWDPCAVDLIIHACKKLNLKIVISSTWKQTAPTMLELNLKKFNLFPLLHDDWKTPSKFSATRGDEIWLWLQDHPEVIDYVIVDDDIHLHSDQMKHFIQCSDPNGLLYEQYEDIINYFKEKN